MKIYQHFRKEEIPFVDEVIDWTSYVKDRYVPKRSDFLDPRQQQIVKTIVGDDPDVNMSFWGGAPETERHRLLLLPPYYEPESSDYGLILFSVNYPQKFASISHRSLLGAVMNLGLRREKFGDLLFSKEKVQIVVAEEIADFVKMNINKVGKTPVKLEELTFSKIIKNEEKWHKKQGTVSSLRLDVVIAEIYHLTRTKTSPYIHNHRVKVNWKVVDQPAYQLQSGDTLSVKGLGRSQLIEVDGKTKKGKWRIIAGRLK